MRRKRIQQVTRELSDGERLLKQQRRAVKRAKGKVAKDNQRRELKVMKRSVEALDDQTEIIKQGGEIPLE